MLTIIHATTDHPCPPWCARRPDLCRTDAYSGEQYRNSRPTRIGRYELSLAGDYDDGRAGGLAGSSKSSRGRHQRVRRRPH